MSKATIYSITIVSVIILVFWYAGMSCKPSIISNPGELTKCQDSFYIDLNLAIQNKNCVKVLKLPEANLYKFPLSITEFKNLQYLNLAMNHIDSLPVEINKLTNLTDLVMGYGYLKYLPPSIGELKKLRNLDLLDNDLAEIPTSIGNLSSLEWLNLHGNPIKHLPETVANLKNLKRLTIPKNEDGTFLMDEVERNYIKSILPSGCKTNF